jgi:hypothetical protein
MQGLHKAVRTLNGRSAEEISMAVKDGSVLAVPWHSSRELQLQKHFKEIADLEEKYADAHWVKKEVEIIQQLESEWTYPDFELAVLNALPALQ